MNTQKKLLILFLFIVTIQWMVPAKMIYDQESIRFSGTAFKFKIKPIDPVDPFRGNYIVLSFDENTISKDGTENWVGGEKIYVSFTTDSANFAQISGYSRVPFTDTKNFVEAKVEPFWNKEKLTIKYPFSRFYLDEARAIQAENDGFFTLGDTTKTSYAMVYLKNGRASITDVVVNGVSVLE
ncbi:MAG: GDYXXLXY domain-containing protein [Cryomorphaceae bacterium]|nr:GDYXXLXY domain-containing protein [Cryomorphaceae bacterium]